MAKTVIYHMSALTGGAANALDSIDGNELEDGYRAIVMIHGTWALHLYTLDADSGAAESSPAVIRPDTNYGNKRWIKCS